MWFSRKQVTGGAAGDAKSAAATGPGQVTTKSRGDAAEAAALAWLAKAGLKLIETNYRTPGRGGGEIDLVMRARDGTLVFVEVRQRSGDQHGGAAASIGAIKQQRIIHAARHYLTRFASPPPCRFDVVLVNGALDKGAGGAIEWLPAAFDAS
jgi:putative endonuclease